MNLSSSLSANIQQLNLLFSLEKSFDFAVRIVNLYKYLINSKKRLKEKRKKT